MKVLAPLETDTTSESSPTSKISLKASSCRNYSCTQSVCYIMTFVDEFFFSLIIIICCLKQNSSLKLQQLILLTIFLFIGGHDDKKVMIPTQVILRNMFAPAELRVSS
jgi:hypothetical protein